VNIFTRIATQYPFPFSNNSRYKNSVFLAGVARSGTTWISDILNYENEYRYIFEPFDSDRVKICREFKDRQYIRPNNKEERFLKPARAILSGRIRSEWSDRLNKNSTSNKKLIKDVRANLFLKWLHNNFPDTRIVLVLRHPCAIASSRIKLKWKTSLNKYLAQRELMEDFLNPFRKELERSEHKYEGNEDIFENSIFAWCIQNYVPLKQFKEGEIYILFYEKLCTQSKFEIKQLFDFLGKEYDDKALTTFNKPSVVSQSESSIIAGGSLIDSWKKHVTYEQIQRATEILNLFGFNKIYLEGSMPCVESSNECLSNF
jgi:hypothetical protein